MATIKYIYDGHDYKFIKNGDKIVQMYRIIAFTNFKTPYGKVNKGDKGGYVASQTLSHDGNCWVAKDAMVGDDCYVSGDAYIAGSQLKQNVVVGGSAYIKNSTIDSGYKCSIMAGSKVVDSEICGNVFLDGESQISNSKVYGNVFLENDVHLDKCEVKGYGNGIKAVGTKRIKNALIEGTGILGMSDSVKVSEKERSR